MRIALTVIAALISTAAVAQTAPPAGKAFPPQSYTFKLPTDATETLLAVFPTAEFPSAKWGPVMQSIQQQIGEQNKAAQDADAAAAKKPDKK